MDTETDSLHSSQSPTNQHVDQSSRHTIYPSLSEICKSKHHSISPYIAEHAEDNPVYNGLERFVRRKRGRPRKYWPIQAGLERYDTAKRKRELTCEFEMPPLNFVDRRQSDLLKPVAMTTHVNEQHWSTNKGDFTCSELIKKMASKHGHVSDPVGTPVSNAYGCLECHHGNDTCCPYDCRGNFARLFHGQEKLLHEDPYHARYNPARSPLERVHDVIGHSYANFNSLKHSDSRSLHEAAEASPFILECYSLAKGKGDTKVPLHRASHPSINFESNSSKKEHVDRDCQLTYSQNYIESKPCDHLDRNCVVCHQIATAALAQAQGNSEHKASCTRDHQTRVIPVLPVLPVLKPHQTRPTETESPRKREDQNTCKSPQRCACASTRSEAEDMPELGAVIEKRTIDKDYYEVYHSKYYKKNPKFEEYHQEKTKMSLERADRYDHVEISPSGRNNCNEDETRQENEGTDANEHFIDNSVKRSEGDMKNKEKAYGGVTSSFDTREVPSLHESEEPPSEDISNEAMSNDVAARSPDNLVEFVEDNLKKNWNSAYKEIFQDPYEHNSSTKGHSCRHCGRVFTHLSSLNNHVRTHTGQKPFRCRYCGKRFAQSGVLTAHLRTHTGDRPFECSFCKKRFAQTTTLANHVRTHTGQKPFSCKYCKRKFTQSSTRNKHELSHTKQKPYTCKFCGRSFGQSATVTRHMRIHMRQETYLCVHCGKEFPFLHVLDKHLDTHNR